MRLSGPDMRKDGSERRIMEGGLELLDTYTDTLRGDWGDGADRVRVREDGRQLEQWDLQIELSPSEKVALRLKKCRA